jgi:hypothetical protein
MVVHPAPRARLCWVVLVSTAGCTPTPTPPPPTDLSAISGGSFDAVWVRWVEPLTRVDGYELEAQAGSGAFERIHTGLIPRGATDGQVTMEPSLPELTTLGFRIRSVRDGVRSVWSPTASYLRGIRPPEGLTVTLVDGPAIDVSWTNTSTVADEVLVERTDSSSSGLSWDASFTAMDVAFGATTLHDAAPNELVYELYRVSYGKGDVWSSSIFASAGPLPLLAPTDVSAAVAPGGGVDVTWTNHSRAASSLVLTPWPPGTGVPLALDVTAWHDATPIPWPSAHYAVSVWGQLPSGVSTAAWDWALVAPFRIDGPRGPLDATSPAVAGGIIRRAGDGTWYWLWGDTVVSLSPSGATATHALGFTTRVNPGLELDGADRPHAVGYTRVGDTFTFEHDWLTVSGWTSEILQGYQGGGSTMQFAVDGLGRLHIVENDAHCIVAAGRCNPQALPTPTGFAQAYASGLATAADGTAYLVLTGPMSESTAVGILTRAPAGAWSFDQVPLVTSYNPEPRLVPGPGGDVDLLFHRNPSSGSLFSVVRVARRGGVWSAEEAVGLTNFSLLGAVGTHDLSQLVAFTEPGAELSPDLVLWTRGPDGWSSAKVGSACDRACAVGGLGVLDSGRAWILAQPSYTVFSADPEHTWSLFEEP